MPTTAPLSGPAPLSGSARRALIVLAAALLGLALAGCGSKDTAEKSPQSSQASPSGPGPALAEAKETLDQTSGVTFSLSSSGVPSSATAILDGSGTLTHAPAFDGKITVQLAGVKPQVPIIAVGGKVYAQLPLTTGWQTIDPSAYGAPDPAALIATSGGLSDWLTATEEVKKGGSVRGGEGNKEILTTYTGTLPAASAKVLVPTISTSLDATYTLTDDGELRQVKLTGDIYNTGDTETYTVTLENYGTTKSITAPK